MGIDKQHLEEHLQAVHENLEHPCRMFNVEMDQSLSLMMLFLMIGTTASDFLKAAALYMLVSFQTESFTAQEPFSMRPETNMKVISSLGYPSEKA